MTRPEIERKSPGPFANTNHHANIMFELSVCQCSGGSIESYQRLKKMVLDAALLNTQYYKVRIKGKVEQSREKSCT